ncbi:MAG: D-TA family PLP-dependent enzyme [Chitinophagaceae bacterium]
MDNLKDWYHTTNISEIDSPALVIYKDRVIQNINTAISMVDDVSKLRPHVKTHKTKEAAQLMIDAGINKFKCATIAEAEMLAMINTPDVLLAYQPIGPKLNRFIALIKKYPATKFSCLVDNIDSAKNIAEAAAENDIEINVYIDLNIGMNRTGIAPGSQAMQLYTTCANTKGIQPTGLHAYDGHIRTTDLEQRTIECNQAFETVTQMQQQLQQQGFSKPVIIAGGSPTFPIHAKRKEVECSPGTFVYWDKTYLRYTEQHFVPAALVITRIISLPGSTKLCLDIGHKSISAENELSNRVYFLNAPPLQFVSHSEEHLVAEAPANHTHKPGDILYGLPVHICPTCALYERAFVVQNNRVTTEWKMIARDRKIEV